MKKIVFIVPLLLASMGIYAADMWVYGVTVENSHWKTDDGKGNRTNLAPTVPAVYTSKFNQTTYFTQYGWYDVNKRSLYYGDNRLCWATVASNMLQWWIDQNKAYISDMENIPHGWSDVGNYLRGGKEHTNRIFDDFCANFVNQGGKTASGIYWYFVGDALGMAMLDEVAPLTGAPSYATRGGYLEHRMQTTDGSPTSTALKNLVGVYDYNFDKYDTTDYFALFQTQLLEALRNESAVGISIPGHALTVWGCALNDKDSLTALYISDSDDDSFNGIVKYDITRGSNGEHTNYAYINNGTTTDVIIRISTLKRGAGLFRVPSPTTDLFRGEQAAVVWAENGQIHISQPHAGAVEVFALSGERLARTTIGTEGCLGTFAAGCYLVRNSDGAVQKIIVGK